MIIKESNSYQRDIKKSKVNLSSQIQKVIELLKINIEYPSLQNKNITCKRANNMFSIRVNKQYRILYFKYQDYYELHRLLDHDKYDRLTKDC